MRTLIDSGLDGNMLFIPKRLLGEISHEKMNAAETWQTSNGTSKTTHVELRNDVFTICRDIVIVDGSDGKSIFNLILGIEILANVCVVLDFQEQTIQIHHTVITMRPYKRLARKGNICVEPFQTDNTYVPNSTGTFTRDHIEPISTQ